MKPTLARKSLASAALFLLVASPWLGCSQTQKVPQSTTSADRARAIDELNDATTVLGEMAATKEVPLAQRLAAKCVVVAPAVKSGAFLVGGSRGHGVATCRTARAWSAPTFVTLSGASAGLQVGGQKTDLLLIVTSAEGMNKLFTSSFQLGADASVAAGPVSEGSQATKNVTAQADILSYARSRGLFAGAQLSGVWVKHDSVALSALYGPTNADIRRILDGAVAAPPEAKAFLQQVAMVFPQR